ncbi:MAG: tRNA (adenosine(37)-N6)-threonylcarbamoyltransferase complex dimerization subunit type 1 TsaB [Alphaproteobacteria bacterium]|jgi:tRNA threonylcarbamoyl adenosine modification protein YeaZ|nr:tRNA (adenosine(37)-N6)-threonylcarbamoyltransferase complex dimerization subunit type 1 TsaB [Alphaproteobacteria bacterium]
MYGLALDTSNKLQLALCKNGVVIDSVVLNERTKVSDVILQYIAELLERNQTTLQQLQFIALINGAGYFTGVRIAIVVAKILHLSLNIPVFSFSSSNIMAREVETDGFIVATVDIGKSGCVLAVFKGKEQIVADIYVDEEELSDFFKNNAILSQILPKNLIFVGNKQNLFLETDYFFDASYRENITAPSMKILLEQATILYNSGVRDTKIEPLYAKEVDMLIRNT